MNQVISIVILVVIAVTIASQSSKIKTETVLGETAPTSTSIPTLIPTDTIMPTLRPTVTVTVAVTPSTMNWQYPGSQSVSDNQYTSRDSAEKITAWYRNKIEHLGFNAKSFVQTNTNDRVLNKLVAARANEKIEVEISKDSNEQLVTIRVVVDN